MAARCHNDWNAFRLTEAAVIYHIYPAIGIGIGISGENLEPIFIIVYNQSKCLACICFAGFFLVWYSFFDSLNCYSFVVSISLLHISQFLIVMISSVTN